MTDHLTPPSERELTEEEHEAFTQQKLEAAEEFMRDMAGGSEVIDHKDGDPRNNDLANLEIKRAATVLQSLRKRKTGGRNGGRKPKQTAGS
jgi:HNH endonuclease